MSDREPGISPVRQRQLRAFGFVLITLVVVSMTFRVLMGIGLQHTSLVFVGLPAMLAWIIASTEPPTTAMGSVMRTTTLALLVAWIFLGEAFICVLMAAPIFYLVAWFVGWVKSHSEGTRAGLLGVLLIPFALEGTSPVLSTERDREVTAEVLVAADMATVREALGRTPRFERELPTFFQIGFPTPMHPDGEGLHVGARRSVHFAHGAHHSGRLVLEIVESIPERVRFKPVSDDSYLTHWLSWRESIVELEQTGKDQTRVRWTLRYARRLDPSWYFDPLERYGVGLAAKYLVETLGEAAEGAR
jgi:hypothetical protein